MSDNRILEVNAAMREYLAVQEPYSISTNSPEGQLANQAYSDQIPAEILSDIFIWLKIMFPMSPSHFFAWAPILLVNRHWNNVATNCSYLWTELDISFNIPQRHLDNSCAQPLSLHWSSRGSGRAPLERYSAYIPRARRLHLFGMPAESGRQAFHGITSLPLLEELIIYPTTKSPFPETFACDHFPNLTSLRISLSWSIEWCYGIFSSNLRRLYVDGSSMSGPIAVADLAIGLQNMPLLECLHLLNVFPAEGEAGGTASIVPLQRLKFVSLSGALGGCTALLRCLRFSPSTNIDIGCNLPMHDWWQPEWPNDHILGLSEALGDKLALRDDSGQLLSPMKYMLYREYLHEFCVHQGYVTSFKAMKLHFMRDDRPSGESVQQNLQFFEGVWHNLEESTPDCDDFQDNFRGVRVLLLWDSAWGAIVDELVRARLPTLVCQSLPLELVTTVALDPRGNIPSRGLGRLCPNVTTVLASDPQSDFSPTSCGLSYLLDIDEEGRLLNCVHFPKMQNLVLDRGWVFSTSGGAFVELKRTHHYLQQLPISSTSILKNIYLVASPELTLPDGLSNLPNHVKVNLENFKADFPHIGVILLDYDLSEWARV